MKRIKWFGFGLVTFASFANAIVTSDTVKMMMNEPTTFGHVPLQVWGVVFLGALGQAAITGFSRLSDGYHPPTDNAVKPTTQGTP